MNTKELVFKEAELQNKKQELEKQIEMDYAELDRYSDRNSFSTLFLAIFPPGVHRLLNGKIISGLIYMFTGGGFLIWMLIDLVVIGVGKFKDKDGRYINSIKANSLAAEIESIKDKINGIDKELNKINSEIERQGGRKKEIDNGLSPLEKQEIQKGFKKFLEIPDKSYNEETDIPYVSLVTENGKVIQEKVELLEKGVQEGSMLCCSELGQIYAGGRGIQKDLNLAEKYLRSAAECGDTSAMAFLSFVYFDPEYKDFGKIMEAFDWICKAALKGGSGRTVAFTRMEILARDDSAKELLETRLLIYYQDIWNKSSTSGGEDEFLGWCNYIGLCCRKNIARAVSYWKEGEKKGNFACGAVLKIKKLL